MAGPMKPRRNATVSSLTPLIEEVGESFGLPGQARIRWIVDAEDGLEIDADRGQLYRILTNLVRNAMQVLEAPPRSAPARNQSLARKDGEHILISVCDNGPGVPARARANLFQAFQGCGARRRHRSWARDLRRTRPRPWRRICARRDRFRRHTSTCVSPAPPLAADLGGQARNLGRGILAFSRSKH